MVASEFDNTSPGGSGTPSGAKFRYERRANRRFKITQWMRLQPSDPQKTPFDDLRSSQNISPTGAYFQTSEPHYEIGMRLFLTMPYSKDPSASNRQYLAEVVRKESLTNGMDGVGVKILVEMRDHPGFSVSPVSPPR